MKVEDILDQLPFELAARLESDPFFADIPIVVAVKGNIARELQQKQALITSKGGKTGVAVIVLQIVANDIYTGLPGGPMKLRPALQVIENVELNNRAAGTKKSCRKIARHIILNLKIAGFRGLIQALTCDNPAIEPIYIGDTLGEGSVCEQVNFTCQEFSDQTFLYCLPPTASQVPGQLEVTLATNTPGAQIWYTTDDRFPYPGDNTVFADSTSQLYTAPIAVTAGQPVTIRAMAHLPGYIDSSIERFTLLPPSQ